MNAAWLGTLLPNLRWNGREASMFGKLGRSIVALALLCAAQSAAWAQAWPAKPIRIVVPFTPGGGTDIIARTVTERLSPQFGQPIVIENRPGAGGTIGAALVAKSAPDGYTLFVHSSSYTVTPSTYKDLPYDTLRDLTGVVPLALLPNVLVMSPSKGIRSVKDLVAAAKAKPGSLNSASVGIGSATHLNAERFRLGAGIETVNVPFKGSPEALTEIVTGRVDFYFCPVNAILPLLKDGKLVALAVPTSAAASAAMNSRRGPGSFLRRRKKPTGRGGRASSSRSRFVGAESRPSAAEESNCRDKGRRVSEPIARAAGASRVFAVSTSSFTVFVTS